MIKRTEIEAGLRKLGLKNGDIVLLHSSLLSLGKVENGPGTVVDAFLNVLGAEGTLVVPVFGALGVLTEEVKTRSDAVVSPCPKGTVAAIGAKAEAICRDHWKADTIHGENTPYTRIAQWGGYICLLGVDQDRNTTLHSVEALLQLPYLSDTKGTVVTPDGEEITKTWKYYPGPHRDFIGLDAALRPAMRQLRIGNAEVRLIKSQSLLDIAMELGRRDPAFALCDNPACADCVRQRAAIFRDRIEKESFTLAASSRLAGRYIPEMIETLRQTGIDALELDFIQGKAWFQYPADKLTAWVAELRESNITITGGRCWGVPDPAEKLVDLATAAGINRLILPLSGDVAVAEAVANSGLTVDFYNTTQAAMRAAERHTALQEVISSGFVFNPANFLLAGEMPFLQSFKLGRFTKTICQLDIVDRRWDGAATDLMQGNAEIKELVSILRCKNFGGVMTLSGGVATSRTLKEYVTDFTRLLDTIGS